MKEELEKASVTEVIPDYNREQQWAQLSSRIPGRRVMPWRSWSIAAGLALLIAGGYALWKQPASEPPVVVSSQHPAWLQLPADTTPGEKTTVATTSTVGSHTTGRKNRPERTVATNEIYNGTPCPIALRINQVKICPNVKPEPISSSSTLQPEERAKLNYEDHDAVASNCSLTVKEIEIKSIATGDVILLNASSTPATVQEAFRILTREHEGKILAGAFDHDCRKKNKKLNLQLDNRDGRLSIE